MDEELSLREEADILARENGFGLKSIVVKDAAQGDILFIIETMEGKTITARLSQSGVTVLESDGSETTYETMEAMLMTISPYFQEEFHKQLFSRLTEVLNYEGDYSGGEHCDESDDVSEDGA
mmetsp:Transcript_15527/g.44038  ORF Transcript_15527/g.44038 Transcript_15527/m.44038 type:complete len:122 (+) Transcript_15527:148-513(+)